MKKWLAAALALVFATGVGAAERLRIPVGNSPALGPADAPVTIFEFVDFQ